MNGVSDAAMKRQIQRAKPTTLNDAIKEGCTEWELRSPQEQGTTNKPVTIKTTSNACSKARGPEVTQTKEHASSTPRCQHCQKGFHVEADC